MKLNLSPLVIAIAMTATSASSTFLRSKTSDATVIAPETSNKHLGTRQGEIMVEIDHTAGDDLSEECRMILIDAFSDSFNQVYGVDGMHALIESEQTFPNRDAKQANLQYYGAQWRVYWRCMKCSGDNNDGPSLLLSDKRFEQEEAMLAIAKASDCEAFHSATVVKITDPDETTKKYLSTARQGEIMVEIDHTAGDDLSEECRMILIDAFSDSFSQVYGVDGMHALIESEQTFPNRDAKQTNLQYYGAKWRVYWRCMKCSGDNNDGPSLLLSDKRFEQEEAMLAIAKASDCEAFHSATVVKITDPDETTEKYLSTARQGEIMVEIDHTAGDDLSEECRMILIDAFSDSFNQVYGVDGMHALIESEQTFPNRDAKQANLQYYGAKWRVYWRCMKCSGDNNDGPSLLLSDKRFEQEEAMLAIAKASDCEAFHSATVVKITDPDETTKKYVSTARQGEIMVEIDHTAGDDLSEECRMILIDAFSDSFNQVYGVDGMHALIESEQTFPNRDAKQTNLQYYGAQWRVYWRCMKCSGDNNDGPSLLLSDKRFEQEEAMLAIAKASDCEAFHSATVVKITDPDEGGKLTEKFAVKVE